MDMGKGPVDGPCWPWSLDCNLPFQLPITSFIHPSSLWDSRSCTYSRINRHAQDSKYPSWQVSQHFVAITWPNQRNLTQFAKLRKLVVKTVDCSLKNVFAIATTRKLSKRNSGQTQDWPLAKLQSPFPASLSLSRPSSDCNLTARIAISDGNLLFLPFFNMSLSSKHHFPLSLNLQHIVLFCILPLHICEL